MFNGTPSYYVSYKLKSASGHRPGECIPNVPDPKPQYVDFPARPSSSGGSTKPPPKAPGSSPRSKAPGGPPPKPGRFGGARRFTGKHPVITGVLSALTADALLRRTGRGGSAPLPVPEEKPAPSTALSGLYAAAVADGVPHILGGAGLGELVSRSFGGPKWLGALLGGVGGYAGRNYINELLRGK